MVKLTASVVCLKNFLGAKVQICLNKHAYHGKWFLISEIEKNDVFDMSFILIGNSREFTKSILFF